MSKSCVHRWKLISGFGREQLHSGPLENDSTTHTKKKRVKYHNGSRNGTHHRVLSANVVVHQSLSLTGRVADITIVFNIQK